MVASIRMDDGMYICDDSCIYANDQMCDEEQVREERHKWDILSKVFFRDTGRVVYRCDICIYIPDTASFPMG